MKRRSGKTEARVIKAPPRPFFVRAAVALLLLAFGAAFLYALAQVDRNSRAVGWNQARTEFSVSVQGDSLRLVAFGAVRTVAMSHVRVAETDALAVGRRAFSAVRLLQSPAQRWTQAACAQVVQAEGWRVQRAFDVAWQAGAAQVRTLTEDR